MVAGCGGEDESAAFRIELAVVLHYVASYDFGFDMTTTPNDRPRPAAIIALMLLCLIIAGIGGAAVISSAIDVAHNRWLGFAVGLAFELPLVIVAVGAYFRRTSTWVRWLCAMAAIIAAGMAMSFMDRVCIKITGFPFWGAGANHQKPFLAVMCELIQLLIAILAVISYRFCARWLIAGLKLNDDHSAAHRLWSIKMSLGIVAFCIFSSGEDIASALDSRLRRSSHPAGFSEAISIFGPLILAILVYKIGMYLAARKIKRESATFAPAYDAPLAASPAQV